MIRNLLTAALLISASIFNTLSAGPPARTSDDKLVLKAWLQVADGVARDVIVEVEVNGVKGWGRANQEGRVECVLPANEVAMIHFRKAGHITKSVRVDTHHAQAGEYKGKTRSIDFGVVLVPSAEQPGLVYAGPVASIAFSAEGGGMTVETDSRLVPAGRQQSIVF
ncbi:MAG: hypothetical protein J5I62_11530 [Flavobacteriales bacterium]|nr:hypothetical protein [Flavobacteriales bacterium]MEB2341654.1 hypothetical protein [Flavobacteriia bacterium]